MSKKKISKQKKAFYNLRMWFWTQRRLIKELNRIDKIVDQELIQPLASRIKELRQDKVYFLEAPGASLETMKALKDALSRASKIIRWTPPRIMLLNEEMSELTEKIILKKAAEIKKRQKVKK